MEQLVNILRSHGFSAPLNITLKSDPPLPRVYGSASITVCPGSPTAKR